MALLQEIKVPLLSVNDTTLTVVETSFRNGDRVNKNDIIMVFETSKTTYDVVAESDGFIQYNCEAGSDYEVNAVVANIFSEQADLGPIKQDTVDVKLPSGNHQLEKHVAWQGETMFSLDAEVLIEKNGYDKSVFLNRDFISRNDVEEHFGLKKPEIKTAEPPVDRKTRKAHPLPDGATFQKLSSNKKREIEYLSAVQSAGLTSTLNIFVETNGILKNINRSLKYLKNSILPVIIYECSRLLDKYPLLNSFFNDDSIGLYEQVNVGFAIDADKGLKVLKIDNTSTRSIYEIEEDIMRMPDLYLQDKLGVEHLSNVTFTITDLSSLGVSAFQPLVNMNNCAILGISAIDEKLNRCNLSITFDHRVTEGKLVAVFLKELKERIETYKSSAGNEDLDSIQCLKCQKRLAEDLSGIGFVKCITTNGNESYVCQSCFKGF